MSLQQKEQVIRRKCEKCNGTGEFKLKCFACKDKANNKTCRICQGKGYAFKKVCAFCNGLGYREREIKICKLHNLPQPCPVCLWE